MPDSYQTNKRKNKNKPGRSSSKQFKFGKGHKLESTHAQEIRSKQAIPIHLGKVPSLPILKNDFSKIEFEIWKKKANKFAAYFLTAFRPEDNNYDSNNYFNKLDYTWDALESWIDTLEKDKGFISTARLDMIYSTIYGMTTENTAKILLSKYRRRARDIWTDEDIASHNSLRSNHKKDIYCANEAMDGLINSMEINYLSTKKLREGIAITKYSRSMTSTLKVMSKTNLKESNIDEIIDEIKSIS